MVDYFPELFHLNYYQRNTAKKTTLRFQGNSNHSQLLFYDKLAEFRKKEKLIKDDLEFLTSEKNLMRIELQMQSRVSKILKKREIRVYDLYSSDFCKYILKHWLDLYLKIEKKSLLVYPKKLNGLIGFDKLMKKFEVYILGWETLNYLLKQGVDFNCISASDKSKKLKQYKIALSDDFGFEFEQNTLELNHKVKVMYVETLKQIFRMR